MFGIPKTSKGKYILFNKKVVQETNLQTWCEWIETEDRIVSKTIHGDYRVSTVFLGLHYGDPFNMIRPIVFETMIFKKEGGTLHYMTRCCTWRQARGMHFRAEKYFKRYLKRLKKEMKCKS